MAFNYRKQDGDKRHRIVSLMNDNIGPWMDFNNMEVEYPEQCVLEIEREDGTMVIEYERSTRTILVGRNGNELFFSKDIPLARMWVRGTGSMMYKVPYELQEKDGKRYMLIPGEMQNIVLGGDKYFNKVYSMTIG